MLQILYAWEIAGDDRSLEEQARRTLGRRRVSDRYRPYIGRLLELLTGHMDEIDETLRDVMPNWRLERLATIDRNVLRIGAAELLFADDIPGKVAISEGIELAEKYGGRESPGFVNGVLDAIYQERTVAG
jgi:N utilization substance protein B